MSNAGEIISMAQRERECIALFEAGCCGNYFANGRKGILLTKRTDGKKCRTWVFHIGPENLKKSKQKKKLVKSNKSITQKKIF